MSRFWCASALLFVSAFPGAATRENVLTKVNETRSFVGAGSVVKDQRLMDLAQQWSVYSTHAAPHRPGLLQPGFQKQGEVVCRTNRTHHIVSDCIAAWLRSPSHREVLLDPAYEVAGWGATRRDDDGWTVLVLDLGDYSPPS